MSWLEAVWLAEIHRETYIAILESWVPHGKRGDFAHRVGISREYFSYLCALDHPAEGKYPIRRLPSPELAKKMAKTLPAPPEVRSSLIENMELAHVQYARVHYSFDGRLSRSLVSQKLDELEKAHRQATFGAHAAAVKKAYRVVRQASAIFLQELSPEIYPVSFAQACLYIHDAQCILDRPDDALKYARLAGLVLGDPDVSEPGFLREQIDNIEINAIRGEAVAYHNLGLDKKALAVLARSRETSAYHNATDFWKPYVGRDLLIAAVLIPRFSFREMTRIAQESIAVSERNGDDLILLMTRESWMRCLIRQGRLKTAQQIFREELERLPRLTNVGFLHRALLFKSGASLAWEQKDRVTWEERVRESLNLMKDAGLSHQMRLVQRRYGLALKEILDELEIPNSTN